MDFFYFELVEHCYLFFRQEPCVKTLVEVYGSLGVCELLEQAFPFLASKNVWIAQDNVLLSVPELTKVGNLMGSSAFFLLHYTKVATSWTTPCEKAVGGIFC